MKEIKLISLEMRNFKNQEHLKIDFNGKNTGIYSDNGVGKTTVFDSFTWLLFSKSSKGDGDKNFEVKPLNVQGNVKDHDAITEVEAVLSVDGENVSLKRTYREIWVTKRGSDTPVYDGNTSEFFVNGVPVKKFAFVDKVNELVEEETFKLLTDVSYFAETMGWQERREVLFKAAGIASDAEIMASDERFLPLIEAMGRLSLDDYKKKLLAEKRGFANTKSEIPARISECQRTLEDISALDFDASRLEVERLTVKREALGAEVLRIENDSALAAKRIEIREARVELESLENENRAYRASQNSGASDAARIRARIAELDASIARKNKQIGSFTTLISNYDTDIAASRERWIATNREIFSGGKCYACGQALPEAQLKAAQDSFEASKATRLREIEATANANKKAREQYEARIDEVRSEVEELTKDIESARAELTAAEGMRTEPSDLPDYAERREKISGRIHILEGELADMAANSGAVKNDILRQIADLNAEISKHREILGRESLLSYTEKRIAELEEDAKNASACLDAIEGMLYLAEEYSRYKTKFVEDSINGMFRIARFRLFREQANGGIEDRCDVMYEGTPFTNLNTGARINTGIDIVNTLSVIYGVKVPMFIDNAESVTRLEDTNTQIIRLVVSENDKNLRCEYEK